MEVSVERYQRKKYVNQENSPVLYYIRQKAGTAKVVDIDALAEDIQTEKECTVKNIKRVNVRFIPDKAMKLVNASRSMSRSPNNVNFALVSAGAPEGGGSGGGDIVDDPTA